MVRIYNRYTIEALFGTLKVLTQIMVKVKLNINFIACSQQSFRAMLRRFSNARYKGGLLIISKYICQRVTEYWIVYACGHGLLMGCLAKPFDVLQFNLLSRGFWRSLGMGLASHRPSELSLQFSTPIDWNLTLLVLLRLPSSVTTTLKVLN